MDYRICGNDLIKAKVVRAKIINAKLEIWFANQKIYLLENKYKL